MNLDNYLGNHGPVQTGKSYMENRIDSPLLFSGPIGCGKSTLAAALATAYGYETYEVNASQDRSKKALKTAVRGIKSASVKRKPRLIIIDEIEGMPADHIKTLIKQPGKKILICNEAWKVADGVRRMCHGVAFRRPTKANYQKRLRELGREAPKEIIDQFNSWRDLNNWMDGGEPSGAVILSDFEQAKRIFENKPFPEWQEPTINTHSLLFFYIQSQGNRQIIEQVNSLLSRDKFSKEIARQILLGETISVRFPFRKKQTAQSSTVKFLGFK